MSRAGVDRGTRIGVIVTALGLVLALMTIVSGMGPILGIPILVASSLVGWRLVPGFWRTLLAGVAGGAIAGILILGPGLRLVMRVVAILDPVHVPEFTWEGTLGIVLFVGGISGVVLGAMAALLLRVASRPAAVGAIATLMMAILLIPRELRNEFTELGAGLLVNVSLFAAVIAAFSWVAVALVSRFQPRRVEARRAEEVPA